MTRKMCVFLLVFVLVGTGLMAAGKSETAKAPQKVDIKIIWWGSQTRHEGTIKVIELYKKQNPHIGITYEFSSWADYWTKVTTMAAGGQLPDVMQQDYARIAEWVKRGLHVQLDDYVAKKIIDTTDIQPSLIDTGRIDGKLWAINLGSNSHAMILDADMFKKAGIPFPPKDWTWEDFEKIALSLHEKLGIYGYGVHMWNDQIWKAIYISRGEWIYAPDNKSLGYSDDKPFIEYLEMMKRLVKAKAMTPRHEEIAQYAGGTQPEQTPLIFGKAAMQHQWSNQLSAVDKASGGKRNFVLYPLPRVKGGKSANYIKASQYFSVSSQSKFPEEAARFINFFTNDIEANKILLAERGVPISSKVQEAILPLLPPVQKEVFAFVSYISKTGSPCPPPDAPRHGELVKNLYEPEVVDKVLFDIIDPVTAAKILRERGNAILSKN